MYKKKILIYVGLVAAILLYGIYVAVEQIEISKQLHLVRIVDLNKKDIFETMTNIENYPNVLPNNILSVNIINRTENVIYAEETIQESGFKAKFLVRHQILPYDMHQLEIYGENAHGTSIITTYEDVDNGTRITLDINMQLSGPSAVFISHLSENNLHSAMNSVLTSFVDYARTQN